MLRAAGEAKCPICGSEDVNGTFVAVEGSQAWQKVYCDACEAVWHEVYTMTSVEVLSLGQVVPT